MKKNRHVFIIVLSFVLVSVTWTSSCIGKFHKVKAGETLSEIAILYDVTAKSIAKSNNLKSLDLLKVGEKLVIPIGSKPVSSTKNTEDIIYFIEYGDSLYSIARKFDIQDWKLIQQLNGISNPKRLKIGQKIYIPGDGNDIFLRPLRTKLTVTSRYGYRHHPITGHYRLHEGIDFRAATGTRVYASKTGRVTCASRKNGYGRIISIQHDDDYSTSYAHLSRIYVSVGDIIRQGQVIGLTGNTGVSTGPHLHFEIRYKGKSENPARHLELP